jgi:hypothetical protein
LLTLREEHRLRVLKNRATREMHQTKWDKVTGDGDNYILRSFMICTPHPVLIWGLYQEG